ncbi:MAG: DUF1501 domain-containing protein [Granulosicoccaceae bacterium]
MRNTIDKHRRLLLKQLACLPLASGVSLLAGSKPAQAMTCATGKSLVCIFMAGGADSFNMFVPGGGDSFTQYQDSRRDLAVDGANLINVSDTAQGAFGFHDLMPGFASLYDANRMVVVSNTGTLIRPTTKSDYLATNSLPESLFAHNTQQKLWQTGAGIVSGSSSFGWGGAISEHAADCNGNISIAPAFSIGGSTDWLTAANANYISLNADVAVQRMFGHANISDWIPPQRLSQVGRSLNNLIDVGQASGNSQVMQEISGAIGRATSATASLHAALLNNPVNQMRYSGDNRLAAQLHLVARLIASRDELGMEQQVFFVRMGGWDTHTNQLQRQPPLFSALNEAVTVFQATIDSLNLAPSVTSFTASDFGRTLTSNGNGTDHGWGGHNFVFGGAVDGGRIVGDIPNYAVQNNDDDAGDNRGQFAGRIIPQISVNQYAATLARWMGVSEDALNAALPDLVNFSQRDLGFMT